ncbi:unnamed protein product [Leuciscus chuanchicus]
MSEQECVILSRTPLNPHCFHSGTCSPGKEATGHVFPHWTLSHAEVDGEHTAAPFMGVGTGQHGTLPGLNGAPTLDTWDSGASTLARCQPQRGTFVLLVSVTYPERFLSAGSHASLHSTSHCLCAQLARDSPHFLSPQSRL